MLNILKGTPKKKVELSLKQRHQLHGTWYNPEILKRKNIKDNKNESTQRTGNGGKLSS